MRGTLRYIRTGAIIALTAALPLYGCASGSSTSAGGMARADFTKYEYTGEVYLLRGLANVFSTGLDVMNDRFRAKGVNSRVDNHSVWQTWADDILARAQNNQVSYPIIIMGHSLGGNASVQMARYLGDRGVKVTYVAAFDPTITTEPGPNVARVDNFFLPNIRDGVPVNQVVEGPGFTGTISNIDVRPMQGVDHFNVEKQPQLQDRVISISMKSMKPIFRGSEPGEHR
ncbi:MAG: alpha/beta hydrolase [Nitratireductor sp.]|jgi:pimeloyl-ACP methyl ester carboxylesterase|nr:alpha/beta hydrolase [Nitratireductor sp.]